MKARIQAKIKSRAKRSRVAGLTGDVVRIEVAAPPVDGKANREVVRLIAELANVPMSRVRIIVGETHPMKVIEIDGIDRDEFLRRIP